MRKALVNKLYGEGDHIKEDMVTYPMQMSSYVGCTGVYVYYVIHSYRNLLVQANMRNEQKEQITRKTGKLEEVCGEPQSQRYPVQNAGK